MYRMHTDVQFASFTASIKASIVYFCGELAAWPKEVEHDATYYYLEDELARLYRQLGTWREHRADPDMLIDVVHNGVLKRMRPHSDHLPGPHANRRVEIEMKTGRRVEISRHRQHVMRTCAFAALLNSPWDDARMVHVHTIGGGDRD